MDRRTRWTRKLAMKWGPVKLDLTPRILEEAQKISTRCLGNYASGPATSPILRNAVIATIVRSMLAVSPPIARSYRLQHLNAKVPKHQDF